MNTNCKFNLNSPQRITAILIGIVFSCLCYLYQIINPVCCDAPSYVGLAEQYVARGLIVELSGLRLYGYPLFVAFIINIAKVVPLPVGFILYMVQVGLSASTTI